MFFSAVIAKKTMMTFVCFLEQVYSVIDCINSVLQDLGRALELRVLENNFLQRSHVFPTGIPQLFITSYMIYFPIEHLIKFIYCHVHFVCVNDMP